MLREPAQIRLYAFGQTGNRFNEDRKRGTPSETTGMPQGEDPLHPAIPRFTAGPLVTFAPQDAEAVGALRDVIRRFHTRDIEKHPQRLPFPCQTPSKRL